MKLLNNGSIEDLVIKLCPTCGFNNHFVRISDAKDFYLKCKNCGDVNREEDIVDFFPLLFNVSKSIQQGIKIHTVFDLNPKYYFLKYCQLKFELDKIIVAVKQKMKNAVESASFKDGISEVIGDKEWLVDITRIFNNPSMKAEEILWMIVYETSPDSFRDIIVAQRALRYAKDKIGME